MRDRIRRLGSLIAELRRRRVIRVGGMYILAAAAVAQAADVMMPRLGLPEWTVTLVVVLAVLGLPLAMVLAWAFDVTPEGVRRAATVDTPASQPTPRRRWPLVALLIVAVVMGGVWIRVRTEPPAAVAEGVRTIAVLPFSFRGSEQYDYLGSGLVDLLSTKLDGAGSLRAVGPRAVLGMVRQTGAELDDRAARTVARKLGARLYVLGQVVEVDGRIHLSAAIHRDEGDGAPAPHPARRSDAGSAVQASAEGDAENIFGLVDELAAQLLSRMAGGPGSRVTRVAAATTHSLPALRAYLEGEDLLRGGHFPSALESFRQAIGHDSTFALAHYRLSIAAEWSGSTEATRAAEEAYRRSGDLSEHDRRLVEALLAWRRGDGLEAERLYRAIVGAYPDDVEAWFQLAEVLFHYGPWHGRSIEESREPFERVLFYEPDHVTSLWHLIRVAGATGRLAEMDSLVRRVEALAPEGDRMLELVAIRAFRTGNPTAMAAVEAGLREAIDLTRWMTVWNVAAFAGDVDGAHRLTTALIDPSRSREARATGHVLRAHFDLARGRLEDARAELRATATLDPTTALLHQAVFALHPAAPAPPSEMRVLEQRLAAWEPATGTGPDLGVIYFNTATDARSHVRSMLRGVLSARIGETGAAEARAAELEIAARTGPDAAIATDFLRVVRAEVAMARGDTAAALLQLEQLRGEVWYARIMQSQLLSQSYARLRLAEALETTGRHQDALRWLHSFDELTAYDLVYEGTAALRRASVHERLGDQQAAAADYARAADFWADSDPSHAHLLARAREGLARTQRKQSWGAPEDP